MVSSIFSRRSLSSLRSRNSTRSSGTATPAASSTHGSTITVTSVASHATITPSRPGPFSTPNSTASNATAAPSNTTNPATRPSPLPPFAHPRSRTRYLTLQREHTAQVAVFDALASKIISGFAALHREAEGELRPASAWLMCEMIKAHFELSNDLRTQTYDKICAWEPANRELVRWANAMEDRYALQVSPELRDIGFAALKVLLGRLELGDQRWAIQHLARREVFAMMEMELMADPDADLLELCQAMCEYALIRLEEGLEIAQERAQRQQEQKQQQQYQESAEANVEVAAEEDEQLAEEGMTSMRSLEENDSVKETDSQEEMAIMDALMEEGMESGELSTLRESSVEYRSDEEEIEHDRRGREVSPCPEEIAAMQRLVRELAEEEAAMGTAL